MRRTDVDVVIAPSLLAADFRRLADQVAAVERGGAPWIHLDVMDGVFVPNISYGPPVISSLRPSTKLLFDTHLMITDPERHVEAFRKAGADVITVHWEACTHLQRTISHIHEIGAKAGVALNPATPVEFVRPVIHEIDLLLIMSVNPGFGGQKFLPATLDRLKQARELISSSGAKVRIEVDGGVDVNNVGACVSAGADTIVAGTSVFGTPDPAEAVRALTRAVQPSPTIV